MSQEKIAFPKSKYIHYLIALVVGILIYLIGKPSDVLSQDAITLLAIVIPAMYLWTINELFWSSILMIAMLGVTGIIKQVSPDGEVIRVLTHNNLWMEALGHFSIIMLLIFTLIDGCLNETGAMQKVANWFLTRKFIQGKPYAIITMFLLGNIVVGMFMQNLALAVMYLALTRKLCQSLGLDKKHSLYKCLMIGTLWGNGILSIASPVAKTFPNVIIGLVSNTLGIQITYAQWFAAGIPFAIIMFVLLMVSIRIVNPDVSPLMNFNVEEYKKADPPLGGRGKIALGTLVVLLLIILLPEIIIAILGGPRAAPGPFVDFIRRVIGWGVTVPAIFAVAFLCIVRAEGKPVMDIVDAYKRVNLGLLVFLAAVMFIGTPMGSGYSSNLIPWLNSIFGPLVGGMSPFMLAAVMIIIAIVITNFVTNVVVVNVFFFLGVALFPTGGAIGPAAFAVLAGYAAFLAFATPGSVITAAMYYGGDQDLVPMEVAKHNGIFMVACWLGTIAVIPIVSAVIGA